MINLTINNQKVDVEHGSSVLQAAQKIGLQIPTLCNHKALLPYGACRLCLVDVGVEGKENLQASCTYPVSEGLVARTDTDRVVKTRKIMAELLLARCPNSEAIRETAEKLGVREVRFKKKEDDCILCGLCVRMCNLRMGRAAISFAGRGPLRKVTSPFGKPSDVCQTCGACDFICPTGRIKLPEISKNEPLPIPSEHNLGLNARPSIYIPYPQAVPNKPAIDDQHCVHMLRDECGICKDICEADAIDYSQKDEKVELSVGGIILSPGYNLFDPGGKEDWGYGRFPNVVTAIEFERLLSASGPFSGEVLRPSDKTAPGRIAFIQCVGSRDSERDYCSGVCCMYATKEAIISKEHIRGDLECDIFFMDIRAFSKGFEQYYERAKEQGINYIRCRVPTIEEVPETKNLIVKYLGEDDRKLSREYDMAVLSVGMTAPENVDDLARQFGIELNEYGFCKTSVFKPVETSRDGIYVAGPFAEPKDIPETVMQASGAASRVLSLLSDVRGELIVSKEYPPERDVNGQEPRIGVFVCHCGTNIAGVVNVPEVVEYAKTLTGVVYVENNLYTCSNDTQQRIKEKIGEYNLNRIVVASCTPRTHEPLFRDTIREAGLNPYLFEMANIRDQCSWVHMHEPEKATHKARDLIRMAIAKARLLEPLERRSVSVEKSALVIGGGLSGMTSALELSDHGFSVSLVEKEKELGGNLRHIHFLLNGEKPKEELESLVEKVHSNGRIHVFTESNIKSIEGSVGCFNTSVQTNGVEEKIKHGVVVVATGAKEHRPEEYLYGQDERVITQLELERRLSEGPDLLKHNRHGQPKTVVMIQCVGSRDDKRPYCSRVCCNEAIKNVLKIKEFSPDANVYILYRDIRTYGFKEAYYTEARKKGVAFLRYDEERKPEVTKNKNALDVTIFDQVLRMPVRISADLVVLSAGTVADEGNKTIAQLLKVPLNSEGFFLEAHMKLRPVDFASRGIFLCGLAHSAKSIEESIIQAQAASSRSATILASDNIELEATVSQVVDENCDGCAYCIDPCPNEAITLIEYMYQGAIKKTVYVNCSLCEGCGVCMATCPKQGIYIKSFRPEQIMAMVDAALG